MLDHCDSDGLDQQGVGGHCQSLEPTFHEATAGPVVHHRDPIRTHLPPQVRIGPRNTFTGATVDPELRCGVETGDGSGGDEIPTSVNGTESGEVDSLEKSGGAEVALDFERRTARMRSAPLRGLFILALLYTFYVARSFLLPLCVALIGTFVLAPVVRWMRLKLRLPEGISAAGILVLIAGLIFYTALALLPPIVSWLNEAPAMIQSVREKLREPIRTVTDATRRLDAATEGEADGESTPAVVAVRQAKPGWGETLVTWVPSVLGYAVVTVIMWFFFTTYGDLFLLKVVRILPTFADKKNAVEIAHKIENQISSYLTTITAINMGLGTAIGISMALWGMPNPVLWGVMGGVLNFIPYLGALVGVTVVGLVAFTQFDAPGYALLIPVTYYLLTATEGFIVTPILLGRRLILNPVVIFLGLVFWGWMWSIFGVLLAVPILVVFKIFCDHIKPLQPVGEFLGR
jgi:predicted PurR-regulated permease PerM